MPSDDELYRMMDRAGLSASTFLNSRKGMSKIVLDVRQQLLIEIKAFIERENDGTRI